MAITPLCSSSFKRVWEVYHIHFRKKTYFYGEELLAGSQTSQLENHPLSAAHHCLLNIFAAILPYLEAVASIGNLRTRHVVLTRDPNLNNTNLNFRH
jgi:hypothetical protein